MAESPVVANHTATIIFLHGLGATGHSWVDVMEAIQPSHVKVVCPTAPIMPVTMNHGLWMTAWFDLFTMCVNAPEDEEGIRRSTALVHGMIDDEIKGGITSQRIILSGFSQGGALALYAALLYPKLLGGIMALSCWLPLYEQFPAAAGINKGIPLLQCHGDRDPMVLLKFGQLTAKHVRTFMQQAEFKIYKGMRHASCAEEIQDMRIFVNQTLPSQ